MLGTNIRVLLFMLQGIDRVRHGDLRHVGRQLPINAPLPTNVHMHGTALVVCASLAFCPVATWAWRHLPTSVRSSNGAARCWRLSGY